MPAWEEYKATARERGALAFELYAAESTPIVSPPELQAVLPDHLAYQRELEAAGNLFLAGPLSDDSGELMEGCGLIIYRASSIEKAREFAENDPMHAKGARSFTLRKWMVNEGSPSFATTLSNQKVIVR